jgi:ABC-type bacteriocin/lantibiotic exporter with double-glycine peptidase domain
MNPTWFAQETETSCVAACVRMVLSSLRETWTEEKLRELLGNPILGLTLTATQKRLSESGAKVEIDEELNLDDLRDFTRQNIFPIVGVERHILGYQSASHAVVVIEISSRSVSILDSLEDNQLKSFARETFETAWNLAGKEALLIFSAPQ